MSRISVASRGRNREKYFYSLLSDTEVSMSFECDTWLTMYMRLVSKFDTKLASF